MSISLGTQAEEFACHYLKRQGLKLIVQNYRSRFGEIDLIMQDAQTLVFIEVRARSDQQRVSGAESVSWHKQGRLIITAQRYLQQHYKKAQPYCRFDVLDLQPQSGTFTIQWIKHAFDAF